MRLVATLFFVLCSAAAAADESKTFLCLSVSDNSQKVLVLADVNGEQIAYLDTDEYKLKNENGVFVGPSKEGSSFFKLASGKLELMSSKGMWNGACHQFTNENSQALVNANKASKVVVSNEESVSSSSSEDKKNCNKNPKDCNDKNLCNKAVHKLFSSTGAQNKWLSDNYFKPFVKEAKERGLTCGVKQENTPSKTSSSNPDIIVKDVFNNFDLSQRKKIQNYLHSKGHYYSSIDGKWGSKTARAIKIAIHNSSSMNDRHWVKNEFNKMIEASSFDTSNYTGSCPSEIKACKDQFICNKSTKVKDGVIVWTQSTLDARYVKEAKSRGLTCEYRLTGIIEQKWDLLKRSDGSCYLRNSYFVAGNIITPTSLVIFGKQPSAALINASWEIKKRSATLKFIFDNKVTRNVVGRIHESNGINFSLTSPTNLQNLFKKYNLLVIKNSKGNQISTHSLDGYNKQYKSLLHCNGSKIQNVNKKNNPSTNSNTNQVNSSSVKRKTNTGNTLFGSKSLNDSPSDYTKIISNPKYTVSQAIEFCKPAASNAARGEYNRSTSGFSNSMNANRSISCSGSSYSFGCSSNTGGIWGGVAEGLVGGIFGAIDAKQTYRGVMRACMAEKGYKLR